MPRLGSDRSTLNRCYVTYKQERQYCDVVDDAARRHSDRPRTVFEVWVAATVIGRKRAGTNVVNSVITVGSVCHR